MNSTRTKRVRATFTVPEETFRQFVQYVPERQRSRIIAELMESEIRRRDAELAAACDIVNADPEMAALEADFQALPDTMEEPWDPA